MDFFGVFFVPVVCVDQETIDEEANGGFGVDDFLLEFAATAFASRLVCTGFIRTLQEEDDSGQDRVD